MRVLYALIVCLFAGQFALAEPFVSPEAVRSVKGVHKEIIASGLDRPWGLAWLPDGSMLVTERSGSVRHLNGDGTTRTKRVKGVPEVTAIGQGGLLDIVLHPDFKENGLVYLTGSTGASLSNRTTLFRARFDGQRFVGAEELFRVSQNKAGGQHFGSRLAWLSDKTLLMSIGDGGNPPARVDGVLSRTLAQSGVSHLGKILRFDEDGKPLEKGAFGSSVLAEIHSMGHRNVQGLAYDPVRKTVWVSEHGALGGDELNRIKAGANYGWPKATFSKEYLGARDISDHTSLPGMVDPELVWMTAIAPSGLTVYTGKQFPGWHGDLFAGGLRDQSVRRILLSDDGKVEDEEVIRIGQRVRDVRQGPDGLLYVLTDESDGKVIRLEPSKETDPDP